MKKGTAVFLTAVRAESWRLVSKPWDAFVAFGLPLLLLAVIASMLSSGVIRNAPVAVVDQDNSAFSREAIRNMQAVPTIRVAYSPATVDEAVALMRQGKVYSIAHFPPGFSEGAYRRPEQVTVRFNGAFQTIGALSALGQNTAIAAAATSQLETRARHMGLPATGLAPPSVQVSIIGNPQLSFELFLGGLLTPGVLHLLAACSAVLAAGRLLHGGSFQNLRKVSNGRTATSLIGHLLPHFVIFTLWGLAWIGWLCGVRGWGIAGSMPLLLLGMTTLIAVSVILSGFLVALLGDIDMAFSATAIYSGAAIAFSNGTLPLDHGPRFARIWSDILPYTHYLRLQTGQMVTGAAPGTAWHDLFILVAIALVALILTILLVRWRAGRAPKTEALTFNLPTRGIRAAFIATFRNLPRARPVSNLLILAVVLYAFYYPAAYTGQTAVGLPVAIVTPARTPLSDKLVENLNASHALDVAAVLQTPLQARQMMRQGVIDGAIILPDNFEARLASGHPDGIAVWLNGGYLVRVTSVGKAVAGASAQVAEIALQGVPETARAAKLAPTIRQQSLFNPTQGYGDYAVPAVSLIILQQTLLLGAGVIMALRRETGAPALQASAKLGLWLALTTIGTLSCLFYFGFVFWFQDYPRAGDLWGVVLLAPVFSGSVAALGLLLGRIFDRHERVLQVLVGTSAPLFFLAGAAWPHFMMPPFLVWLAYLSPSTAAVQAFVPMNAMGASLGEVSNSAIVLCVLFIVYGGAVVAATRLRKRA